MARPRKQLDSEQIIQVEALAAVLSLEQIADYFGIHRETFSTICERQPEVFQRYKKGKGKAVANVAKNLLMQAQEGNLTAIIFYLKTQAGWRETASDAVTETKPQPVQIVVDVVDARKDATPK